MRMPKKTLISLVVVVAVASDSAGFARFRCAYTLVDWLIKSKISSLIKNVKIAYGLSRSRLVGRCSRSRFLRSHGRLVGRFVGVTRVEKHALMT